MQARPVAATRVHVAMRVIAEPIAPAARKKLATDRRRANVVMRVPAAIRARAATAADLTITLRFRMC